MDFVLTGHNLSDTAKIRRSFFVFCWIVFCIGGVKNHPDTIGWRCIFLHRADICCNGIEDDTDEDGGRSHFILATIRHSGSGKDDRDKVRCCIVQHRGTGRICRSIPQRSRRCIGCRCIIAEIVNRNFRRCSYSPDP